MKQLQGFKYGARLSDKLQMQTIIIVAYIINKLFRKANITISYGAKD